MSLRPKSADKVTWTTAERRAEVSRPLDEVAKIDLSSGKVVYLSDLKPESVTYQPFFPLDKDLQDRLQSFSLRQDRTLESKPLRLGGKSFQKGLALHSHTEVAYDLPGKFSGLEAIAGIDDEFRPRGNVPFNSSQQ